MRLGQCVIVIARSSKLRDKQESALIRWSISQRSLTVGELVGGIMEKYQECIVR